MRRSGKWKAQSLVEFALVLPLFVLVLFGIAEFGRALLMCHNLSAAARTACRRGTLPGASEAHVEASVNQFLTNAGYTPGTWRVEAQAIEPDSQVARAQLQDAEPGDEVHVRVAMDFSLVTGSLIEALQARHEFVGLCVFRHE